MALLVVCALLCLSCWVSFYFILCYVNGSRSSEWNCRLVTLVHGILAVCITAYIGYVDGPWPFTHPGRTQKLWIHIVLMSALNVISSENCHTRMQRYIEANDKL